MNVARTQYLRRSVCCTLEKLHVARRVVFFVVCTTFFLSELPSRTSDFLGRLSATEIFVGRANFGQRRRTDGAVRSSVGRKSAHFFSSFPGWRARRERERFYLGEVKTSTDRRAFSRGHWVMKKKFFFFLF